ncbi:MAG TPA: polysaccharide biosynthesis/export family protein, partial [Prolixibacteraceae bacterium]|nr:polysaccharide biosynthesis/export family protein [Prolixibacteraceae bacterium]
FLLVFSCRSSKELIYLKDATDQELIRRLPLQETEHILKTGDILYVSIKSINPEVNQLFNPEANMEANAGSNSQKYTTPGGAYLYGYEVDNHGNITLPNLGSIHVEGIQLSMVTGVVQKKADEFLNGAVVNVKLINYKITVAGEVRSPGIYYNYNNSLNIFEALAMANGNTDYASIKNVTVIRSFPEGDKSYVLDLTSKNIYQSEAFYLHPNDYILVQPDRHKSLQLNSQAWSMALSSVSVLLAVLGFIF